MKRMSFFWEGLFFRFKLCFILLFVDSIYIYDEKNQNEKRIFLRRVIFGLLHFKLLLHLQKQVNHHKIGNSRLLAIRFYV